MIKESLEVAVAALDMVFQEIFSIAPLKALTLCNRILIGLICQKKAYAVRPKQMLEYEVITAKIVKARKLDLC